MGSLLILGEVYRPQLLAGRPFQVAIQCCSRYVEGIADVRDLGVRIFHEPARHPDLPSVHLRWATAMSSTRSGGPQSGFSALPYQFAFEFGQRPKDMEDQLPSASCRNALLQALEADVSGSESIHRLDEMLQ
jgi:hypothetical protein